MLLTTRTSYTTSGKFKIFQTELALGFVINSQMLRCLMYGMSKDFLKFTRFRAESLANKILVNTEFGYVQISTLYLFTHLLTSFFKDQADKIKLLPLCLWVYEKLQAPKINM